MIINGCTDDPRRRLGDIPGICLSLQFPFVPPRGQIQPCTHQIMMKALLFANIWSNIWSPNRTCTHRQIMMKMGPTILSPNRARPNRTTAAELGWKCSLGTKMWPNICHSSQIEISCRSNIHGVWQKFKKPVQIQIFSVWCVKRVQFHPLHPLPCVTHYFPPGFLR